MFTKLTRTEGKGQLLLDGNLVVAIFETKGQTVVRTAAGGESASFVVSESADHVAEQLSASGARLVDFTRGKDGVTMRFNLAQIVGVYERGENSVIRTTAGGEHAEFVVAESLEAAGKLLTTANSQASSETSVTSLTSRRAAKAAAK